MDPKLCLICSSPGPGLHRFPRDKKRLTQWLVAINKESLLETENGYSLVYNNGRLCTSHFFEWCFTGNDKKKLIRNAVPNKPTTSPLELPTTSVTDDLKSFFAVQDNRAKVTQNSPDASLEPSNLDDSQLTEESEEQHTERKRKIKKVNKDSEVALKKKIEECTSYAGFDPSLEADRIIGATDLTGELLFLVKRKGVNEADLVPSRIANEKFPQLVIRFYESRLMWSSACDDGDEKNVKI